MVNILDAGNRYKAAGMHLAWSACVAIVAALMVFALWYPWPYRELSGGQELFLLVVSVDIVMGPLLTLAVFNPEKARKVMFRDLAVIVAFQLGALAYGLHTVYIARPVALVLENARFRVISYADVAHEELEKADVEVRSLSLSGPLVMGTREPKDQTEKINSVELALNGVDIGQRPSFWQPYSRSAQTALKQARPVAGLYQYYKNSGPLLDQAVARTGRPAAQLKFLPVISFRGDWSALLDAQSGEVVGFVPLEGFF
jgi:hypothetical protein